MILVKMFGDFDFFMFGGFELIPKQKKFALRHPTPLTGIIFRYSQSLGVFDVAAMISSAFLVNSYFQTMAFSTQTYKLFIISPRISKHTFTSLLKE
jgi:hypothetical protein